MIPILYEDNHLLCINKPINIPVQKDYSLDEDILSLCKAYLKETYHKPGEVYLGLVHRLDRPVGGVMVFAKTSKAASRLSNAMRLNQFKKHYYAIVEGEAKKEDTLVDYLIKDSRTNTVRVTDEKNGKYAKLSYHLVSKKDNLSLLDIDLETGRSHQIRVQLSSRNLAILHDQRYNPNPTKGPIALFAYALSFPHPTKQEEITITSLPPKEEPWYIFEKELCKK